MPSATIAGNTTTGDDSEEGFDDTGVDLVNPDPTDEPPPQPPECELDGTCNQIDLLLVIDNSGTMGEEQLNLARNFPQLVDELMGLRDANGDPIDPDVNIMVTTTDFGHPLCTPFQKPDYEPRQGAPVYTGCNSRIQRFTGLDPVDPLVIEEACTESCPVDVAPSEQDVPIAPLPGTLLEVVRDEIGEWSLRRGETLRDALTRWSEAAGYTLVWQADVDFAIEADLGYPRGTKFRDAIRRTMQAFWRTPTPLVAHLYSNNVLVIAGRAP